MRLFTYWMLYATFLQDSIEEEKVHATKPQLSNHQPTFIICNACSTYITLKYVHYCMNWLIQESVIMYFILACYVFFGMSMIYRILIYVRHGTCMLALFSMFFHSNPYGWLFYLLMFVVNLFFFHLGNMSFGRTPLWYIMIYVIVDLIGLNY